MVLWKLDISKIIYCINEKENKNLYTRHVPISIAGNLLGSSGEAIVFWSEGGQTGTFLQLYPGALQEESLKDPF